MDVIKKIIAHSLAKTKGYLHGVLMRGLLVEVLKRSHALVARATRVVAVAQHRLQQCLAVRIVPVYTKIISSDFNYIQLSYRNFFVKFYFAFIAFPLLPSNFLHQ